MAITRERKDELVSQYVGWIESSRAVFLTEYKGMSVKALEQLRRNVRDAGGTFAVTKNTLLRAALDQSGGPIPEELLTGQTAASFAQGEVPTLAKALVDFARDQELFMVKGGILDGQLLSAEQIDTLAKLPSLDELRAQLLRLISTPATNLAGVVASGVRQVVNVLDAYARQEEAAEAA